jgi:hypothetical protein
MGIVFLPSPFFFFLFFSVSYLSPPLS